MARTRTLTNLIADARKRADQESSVDRFPDSEITEYLNQGIAELYDLLVAARGRAYFAKSVNITTVSQQTDYTISSVAADVYKLVSLRVVNGGTLEPFSPVDEARLRDTQLMMYWPTRYDIRNDTLVLLPAPSGGLTVVMLYIPWAVRLSSGSDTFDGYNGWEEYVIDYAAKMMAVKDQDTELLNALLVDMGNLRARIQDLAPPRDLGRPERMNDVRGMRRHARFRRWFA